MAKPAGPRAKFSGLSSDARFARPSAVMRLSGWRADGNQGLAATFASRPQCDVVIAKEIRYVKDARLVRLGPRFRWRPRSRGDHDNQRTIDWTLGRPSSSLSTDQWLGSDVYKADVYDPSEHKVGKVTDLMIDSNGTVTGAIIGVGGFLGVGQKNVVIPFKALK